MDKNYADDHTIFIVDDKLLLSRVATASPLHVVSLGSNCNESGVEEACGTIYDW